LRVENTGRRLSLFREGRREPIVVQNAAANRRPYLHPLVAPDSIGVLTEDTPAHHPWQHGLYVGLNAVNGVGFWKEGKEDGTFHPEPIPSPQQKRDRVSWQVRTAWRSPDGTTLLIETQGWTFQDAGDTYTLDLDWQLRAEIALTFGEYPYGGLFLRMPYREELGGLALNSEGQKNGDAEGQRARWVAVQMRTEGRSGPAGIALMDHPENPEHPVPWRVDGQLGIAPSRCIAGEWKLVRGETARFRHRVYAFCRPADVDRIEASWNAFAGGKA
jgi:hypothetical protein